MRPRHRRSLVILLLVAAFFCLAASQPDSPAPQESSGTRLLYVDLSVGGLLVKVRAGGVVTVHPDAPFRVIEAKSDSWLGLGLSCRLTEFPELDLNQYHTLAKLLGPRIYDTPNLELEVLKSGEKIGSVRLLVRLLPIDWLRRAADAKELSGKIAFTERAVALTPDDPLLVERLADLYAEAGQFSRAAELLSSHGQSQKDPRWLERLAALYQAAGQKEQAAAALSKLAALRPGDPALLERLALLYEELGRWEEATVLLERLSSLQSGPERAGTLARMAKAQEKAGQGERGPPEPGAGNHLGFQPTGPVARAGPLAGRGRRPGGGPPGPGAGRRPFAQGQGPAPGVEPGLSGRRQEGPGRRRAGKGGRPGPRGPHPPAQPGQAL